MHWKIQLPTCLRSGIFSFCSICFLLIINSLTSLQAFAGEDEAPLHKLATRVFPELDVTIFEVLETLGTENPVSTLSGASAETYRKWHARVQKIQTGPIPQNAKLLIHFLLPDGFDFTLKRHTFTEPTMDTYSREELVLYYFLQIVGIVAKQNDELKPLQAELSELFECNNKHCEILASNSEEGVNGPISSTDEDKRLFFIECMNTQSSLTFRMKEEFCDSFLIWTIQ